MDKIKIGYAPTRRSIFSAPDAVKYRGLTAKRLEELGVDFVDITDINDEGLLYNDEGLEKIIAKFKKEKVDGLFLPHCNFGTEYECARLAKALDVPVLLWGPLDERPEPDGTRLRDTQCGLFATGKVLRRFRVPFTYMTNCRLNDPVFERGIKDFLAVCNVVKTFKNIRILQISTRPFDFWTTMCNEGELLEKFNIQLAPIPMPELTDEVKKAKAEQTEVQEVMQYCRDNMEICIKEDELENVAALKVAMKHLAEKYGCKAIAIQCWNQLQSELGIMPCAANSLLNDEGIPTVCETDIHGAITALMVEAAGMGETRSFFADWTIRHPDVENGELLQHCGPWPISIAKDRSLLTRWHSIIREASQLRQNMAMFLWFVLTEITESILFFLEMQKVSMARKVWELISGLRLRTSNVLRQNWLRDHTSITVSVSTRTLFRYFTRHANISA